MIQVKQFSKIDKVNEFLAKLPRECFISICHTPNMDNDEDVYLVVYINSKWVQNNL